MKQISIAIYLDVENIQGMISFEDLLDDIRLQVSNEFDDVDKAVFGLKKAIGDSNNLKRFRNQLSELNFTIEDAPHIANKKNRADLMISVDALEKLHVGNPEFDLFVFLTSDSDYSIVMNTLRKFNRQVWLVATPEDSQRTVFKSSTDKILIMDDFKVIPTPKPTKKTTTTATTTKRKTTDFMKIKPYLTTDLNIRAVAGILKVMRSYQEEKVYTTLDTNNRFRQIDDNLNLSQTKFKKFKAVYKVLEEAKVIEFQKDSSHQFTINDRQKIIQYLNRIQSKK
ncbi:NYN domain-containing protein [Candidatus Xianfuyuplasma coldseepsis]|uniref:NYN domain-containing protein n=1 Tax=Candidatus Xianfuyuplasma coldseepsis TaxID=2782163 RepID=A0A7L7KNI0_9MOLU|nr:NYN domain-containing protein [Xianfuyuplasma coldseepsis]QMS84213.1 NYN domain-containing protein [Xianfuyuplasma coldseepsis]